MKFGLHPIHRIVFVNDTRPQFVDSHKYVLDGTPRVPCDGFSVSPRSGFSRAKVRVNGNPRQRLRCEWFRVLIKWRTVSVARKHTVHGLDPTSGCKPSELAVLTNL